MIYNNVHDRKSSEVKRTLTMTPYQNLMSYINEIIADKGRYTEDGYIVDFDEISDRELGKLAALFVEYDERDTTDCFQERNKRAYDDNITCALLTLLKNDTSDNRENLSVLIRSNTINRYRSKMIEMIDDRCVEIEAYDPPFSYTSPERETA